MKSSTYDAVKTFAHLNSWDCKEAVPGPMLTIHNGNRHMQLLFQDDTNRWGYGLYWETGTFNTDITIVKRLWQAQDIMSGRVLAEVIK